MSSPTSVPDKSSDSGRGAIDLALIRGVVDRDESALAALYDRYGGPVFSVALRVLNDTQAAEEVLQDVFQHLWAAASRFDPARGSFAGWLVVTARNRSIDRLRRRNPVSAAETLPQDVELPFNLEDSLLRRRLVERVCSVINRLPAEQRALLDLAFFEGLTHTEIAARSGQPLGTVKSRLRAAIAWLKKELQP